MPYVPNPLLPRLPLHHGPKRRQIKHAHLMKRKVIILIGLMLDLVDLWLFVQVEVDELMLFGVDGPSRVVQPHVKPLVHQQEGQRGGTVEKELFWRVQDVVLQDYCMAREWLWSVLRHVEARIDWKLLLTVIQRRLYTELTLFGQSKSRIHIPVIGRVFVSKQRVPVLFNYFVDAKVLVVKNTPTKIQVVLF